jgi:hypothetical protein
LDAVRSNEAEKWSDKYVSETNLKSAGPKATRREAFAMTSDRRGDHVEAVRLQEY